jgi:hypothetical protein
MEWIHLGEYYYHHHYYYKWQCLHPSVLQYEWSSYVTLTLDYAECCNTSVLLASGFWQRLLSVRFPHPHLLFQEFWDLLLMFWSIGTVILMIKNFLFLSLITMSSLLLHRVLSVYFSGATVLESNKQPMLYLVIQIMNIYAIWTRSFSHNVQSTG